MESEKNSIVSLLFIFVNDVGLLLLLALLVHGLLQLLVPPEDGRVVQVELGDDVEAGPLGHREELGQEDEDAAAEHSVLGAGEAAQEICEKKIIVFFVHE